MCGIIGVFGSPQASLEAYRGLLTLQHRGQDSGGILSYHFLERRFNMIKNKGLVARVFEQADIEELPGTIAIGHTRYSTIGRGEMNDIQPFVTNYPEGIGMVHNGNLVNYSELTETLRKEKHCHFLSTNDLEVIQNIFAQALAQSVKGLKGDEELSSELIAEAGQKVMEAAKGGYSVVGILAGYGMFAFRDPMGIRPLVYGSREHLPEEKESLPQFDYQEIDKAYCVSSETGTLQFLGYENHSDILPGEFLFIDRTGKEYRQQLVNLPHRHCMFEWVYFSGAESVVADKAVYASRINLGEELGKKVKELVDQQVIKPDVVICVPETSRVAAISTAEAAGVPYREGLIKNRYIHRSFILKNQTQRKKAVDLKLSPVISELAGKNVLMVDDSVVRGTTSQRIIELVRKAGAKEVYFASTCPPIRHPCFYGVDFPDSSELVAAGIEEQEVAKKIGADRMIYLDMPGLKKAIGMDSLCSACIDGDYPVDISCAKEFSKQRLDERANQRAD